MIPTLQKISVIVLALLQFAAPLVHAHAGTEITGLGVHVPGLESWSLRADVDGLSSINKHLPADSCLVSMSSAIQQKSQDTGTSPSDFALITAEKVFAVALDARLINFSPYPNRYIPKPNLPSYASRAPPFFNSVLLQIEI